ncbi:TIR domain-containing protein [filamentous cyanobacterium LEGE 11480]|uniref:TIR domain-containing protein n=1 Tax=Romeriopsis navalis LEGE 11480 TaxID=2777977 RepID=A0A928VH59_9CYAN|nr:TIR domain-containing protein [Romeriopsis navalis]MBE9028245.1 TIR domain-containing protein [Romeriopsis navalis LEGE 11480]
MQIFLSYASEDQQLAEAIQLALVGADHQVFFDRSSLPTSGYYHASIQAAIQQSDAVIFLISPDAIDAGSYSLTELKHIQARWSHPKQRVLPVLLRSTNWDDIPTYLKSVTVLEPAGNVAAEVLLGVEALNPAPALPNEVATVTNRPVPVEPSVITGQKSADEHRLKLAIAALSLIGVLGSALFANWDKVFPVQMTAAPQTEQMVQSTTDTTAATHQANNSTTAPQSANPESATQDSEKQASETEKPQTEKPQTEKPQTEHSTPKSKQQQTPHRRSKKRQ